MSDLPLTELKGVHPDNPDSPPNSIDPLHPNPVNARRPPNPNKRRRDPNRIKNPKRTEFFFCETCVSFPMQGDAHKAKTGHTCIVVDKREKNLIRKQRKTAAEPDPDWYPQFLDRQSARAREQAKAEL